MATAVAGLLMAGLLPSLGEAATAATDGTAATASFDAVLVWCCAVVAAGATTWLWIVGSLVVLDAVRGRTRVRRGVPAALRRLVLAGCGVAVASGLVAPALAGGGPVPGSAPGSEVLAGLRLPERVAVAPPVVRSAPVAAPAATSETPVVRDAADVPVVVVRPGDSLWSLATADLAGRGSTGPPGAAETAAYWPRLYALNRDVIGPDPARIEPGQRLRLPATLPPTLPATPRTTPPATPPVSPEGDDHAHHR